MIIDPCLEGNYARVTVYGTAHIIFMALSCVQKLDHSTIAAFDSSMDKEIEPLFTKVLLIY
ncbi:MAG: hypothetical protein SWO11_14870, partial [Thermodesulfobacteriota bacterium]|nr:hypothetical protein [Thermodesulfobacteriota bacterium]